MFFFWSFAKDKKSKKDKSWRKNEKKMKIEK